MCVKVKLKMTIIVVFCYLSVSNRGGKVMFNQHELQTILYSLGRYIQRDIDEELAEELIGICNKIQGKLVEVN
tara:strand:- start:45 stop:263 length:219 start_codon:yes stop_codon:yes gene_type:complete